LSHNPVDAEVLAGNKMPPEEWMNQRLMELGENWQFVNPDSTSSIPHIPLKTIVLKNVATSIASRPGEDTKIELRIEVNHNGPLSVMMDELAGVNPVYSDALQQMQMEDRLWASLIALPNGVPLRLPSHNESIAIPMTFKAVGEMDFTQVKERVFGYYFMCHQFNARGTTLLDFCGHVDSRGFLTYCRNHNGP
jgi:hypothetical protein